MAENIPNTIPSELNVQRKEDLLFEAITMGNAKTVASLLDEGINVNCRNTYQQTPLHYAVLYEQVEIVTLLLQRGANMNTQDCDFKTPLHGAIHRDKIDIATILLKNGADPNIRRNLIHMFIHTPLESALLTNNIKIIKLLIDYGADINAKNTLQSTPLHFAVTNTVDVVTLLIKNGAKVNFQNKCGITALHMVALTDKVDVLECLINNGADVNIACNNYWLPLHYALLTDQIDNAICLIENGTNLEYRSYRGDTFLHVLLQQKKYESVKLLFEYNADVNAVNEDDMTPLQSSIKSGSNNLIYLVLLQLIKLRSLGLFVSQKNIAYLEERMNDELKRDIADCEREVEKLKQRKIADTNVSLYKILTKHLKEAMLYLRNEEVKRELSMANFDAEFPFYSRMIKRRTVTSLNMLELICKGHDVISNILHKTTVLPINCIENIVSCFNEQDLKCLINSYKM